MINPRESSIISVSFEKDLEIVKSDTLSENILSAIQYILQNTTTEETETIIGILQQIVKIIKKYQKNDKI